MVYARDSKSRGVHSPCRFESDLRHQNPNKLHTHGLRYLWAIVLESVAGHIQGLAAGDDGARRDECYLMPVADKLCDLPDDRKHLIARERIAAPGERVCADLHDQPLHGDVYYMIRLGAVRSVRL